MMLNLKKWVICYQLIQISIHTANDYIVWNIFEVMIKSLSKLGLIAIFFTFQQLKSQLSQIDQNGVNPWYNETHQIYS